MVVVVTDDYRKYAKEYKSRFGYGVPLEQIPPSETTDGIIANIVKCLEQGENLLPQIYGFVNSDSIKY